VGQFLQTSLDPHPDPQVLGEGLEVDVGGSGADGQADEAFETAQVEVVGQALEAAGQ